MCVAREVSAAFTQAEWLCRRFAVSDDVMNGGGIRAFLRRGKFAPQHSELESFLAGRITREQGIAHIRDAVRPRVGGGKKLRAEALRDLHAWDVVYLDHLSNGRLLPGEPTAAAEPLRGLSANEALLIQQVETHKAGSRRLVSGLPKIIQRSLQALVKKIDRAWQEDSAIYDRLFPEPVRAAAKAKQAKRAVKPRPAARKAKAKAKAGRPKARPKRAASKAKVKKPVKKARK